MIKKHLILNSLILALVIFAIDQAIKFYLRDVVNIETIAPIRLLPFIDIVLVWNRGVSYGLMQQDSLLGQGLLVLVKLAMVAWLAWWLKSSTSRVQSYSIGLIIGGALGNMLDNILFQGVMDYVHLHLGTFSWYVFNFADAAIVAGVVGLFYTLVYAPRFEDVDSVEAAQQQKETV